MSRSTLTRKKRLSGKLEDEIDLTEYSEKDGPPEVSKEQLEELDKEAMLKEVAKLKEMNVIGSIPPEMSVDDALQLDTKNVFDWRFRQNQWTRRCRIVAREFKDSVSTVDTFCTNYTMECSEDITGFGNSDEAQGGGF